MANDNAVASAQYLTFRLARELFAVDIMRVREVLEFDSMTLVPGAPSFMRGVINLRGSVVPVMDLRLKLGLAVTEKSVETCVVIAEVMVDGENTILGALVDAVQEVIDLDAAHVAPPPHMGDRVGSRVGSQVIRGMGRRDEQFIMILDFDSVFTGDELRASAAGTC
jgi:purine-binding chemotaxis protein CheW